MERMEKGRIEKLSKKLVPDYPPFRQFLPHLE